MESANFLLRHMALSCIRFFPPLSCSLSVLCFQYFVGSKLITCAVTAAVSRGHSGVNDEMRSGDSVKPISG